MRDCIIYNGAKRDRPVTVFQSSGSMRDRQASLRSEQGRDMGNPQSL